MTPAPRRFRALVQRGHKSCAVEVPFDPRAAWGVEPSEVVYGRVRGIPVRGKLGGAAFASWIITRWGKRFLLIGDDVLADAGVFEGEEAAVSISPAAPRTDSEPAQG